MNLNWFIGKSQLSAIEEACKGEEGEYFKAMWERVREAISKAEGG